MRAEETAAWAAEILTRYYDNDIQMFLNSCDPDVLWIGPAEKQIIRTQKALKEAFAAEEHQLTFRMHDLTAIPIPAGAGAYEIVLFFRVDTFWPDGSTNWVDQRVQLTCAPRDGEMRIRLCHISNAIQYDERDRIYPVHYEETYHDEMKLVGEKRSMRICVKAVDRALLYLKPENILYIESANRHTMIHTKDQTVESVENISALRKRCGDHMVRCHESFLVNPDFVQEIRRFEVSLTDGSVLPIPEKRYTAVRAQLERSAKKE